jgi:hypothetical protein
MKLAFAAVALSVVAIVVVYLVVVREQRPTESGDPYGHPECGSADLTAGANAEDCRQRALDMLGRSRVANWDGGRALLKRLCDQAYDQACKDLNDDDYLRRFIAEGRCDASWFQPADPAACVDAAHIRERDLRPEIASGAKGWYAKACTLGVQTACNK